jgi:hypothetical protein
MGRTLKQLLRDNSGAVLIYVALAIFALAAIGIIGVDVSRMLVARVQLQNAADAGALAGARKFMDTPPPTDVDVVVEAKDIAGMNKAFAEAEPQPIPRENIAVVVNMAEREVRVTTESDVSQYFLGVVPLGETFGDVSATAVAKIGYVTPQCLKPWSIPDRWDDQTLIPGYPSWRNNKYYDMEDFDDANDNGVYDPGEPYQDDNNDGIFNWEYYDPVFTGYTAAKDHGLQITLKAAGPKDAPAPGQYWPVDLPDENGDPIHGADWYRWNIANCNPGTVMPGDWLWTENGNMVGPTLQGMRDLIAQDPNAYWDSGCECIDGSDFSLSPRIGLIPMHDPRVRISPGKQRLLITKIAAFFIERVDGKSGVVGRFMKVQYAGTPLPPGSDNGGWIWNLSLIE